MIAMKAVRPLAPVGAENHPHRERRPVLQRTQRAEVVGDALGQHRHDAVGEIDRVAALERVAVERRAGPDVGRDVGDGDGDDEAAGVGGIGIGRRVDGVVVVLGVGRIDGDERQAAASPRADPKGATGRAASASFSAAGEKTNGMWCWASAIRLTAFSDLTEPIDSTTRALGIPRRGARAAARSRRGRRPRRPPRRPPARRTRAGPPASPPARRGRSRPRPCGRRRRRAPSAFPGS